MWQIHNNTISTLNSERVTSSGNISILNALKTLYNVDVIYGQD